MTQIGLIYTDYFEIRDYPCLFGRQAYHLCYPCPVR